MTGPGWRGGGEEQLSQVPGLVTSGEVGAWGTQKSLRLVLLWVVRGPTQCLHFVGERRTRMALVWEGAG